VLHLCPHWNWAGREGEAIEVTAFTNQPEVELFLNGQSLGQRSVETNGHVSWSVPYQAGELVLRSHGGSARPLTRSVSTTGSATRLELTLDYDGIGDDGRRIVVVTVEASDSQGRKVPDANHLVLFRASGSARLLGVGNGDPSSHEADQYIETPPTWQRRLFSGKCQVILEAARGSEPAALHAEGAGLEAATLTLGPETLSRCFPQR